MGVLLSLVFEIEEKESYVGGSCIADGFDILDNRRAFGMSISKAIMIWDGKDEPEYTLSGTRYGGGSLSAKAKLER